MAGHKTDDLTPAQKNFLSRRIAAGDELTQDRAGHYIEAHNRAVKARLKVGSPRYFAAVADHADALGGRQPPKQPTAAQPIKARYDGASSPMPKLHGGGDQFQALRRKASSDYRGKK
jgi:hypothetical protein